jgi:hypothetical protein
LQARRAAGLQALEWESVLARTGDSVITEVLRGQGDFLEWDHYPEGDVQDALTGAQYYYHAHSVHDRPPREHGHFHTFVRPAQAGVGVEPAPLPDLQLPNDPEDVIAHLVGVSVDGYGRVFRLFTTNRWVTAEHWHDAESAIRLLDAFHVDHARPSWPVNQWLAAVLRLFRPQVEQLLRERDAVIAEWQAANPAEAEGVYENRSLQVLSQMPVDVAEELGRLEGG